MLIAWQVEVQGFLEECQQLPSSGQLEGLQEAVLNADAEEVLRSLYYRMFVSLIIGEREPADSTTRGMTRGDRWPSANPSCPSGISTIIVVQVSVESAVLESCGGLQRSGLRVCAELCYGDVTFDRSRLC